MPARRTVRSHQTISRLVRRKRRGEVVSCLQAGLVSTDDVVLMSRTGKHPNSAGTDREDGVLMAVGGVPTARTLDPAGRAMFQHRWAPLGGQPTDHPELIYVLGAPDERNSELIDQQERYRVSPRRPKRCIARRTANRLRAVRRANRRVVELYGIHYTRCLFSIPETDTLLGRCEG